jgi:DNA polymerase-4
VGPVSAERLRELGAHTVGQAALLPEAMLVQWLGPAAGRRVHALAHNRDPRPVQARRRRGSIGSQRAGRRTSLADVDADLVALVERVTRRMRTARRVGRTVVLRLRFGDFSRATRSHTLPVPTASTATILAVARALLAAAAPTIRRRGLTLVGVSVANLEDARAVQLTAGPGGSSLEALDDALDEARSRFGSDAVVRAVLLGRAQGIAMPLLPD